MDLSVLKSLRQTFDGTGPQIELQPSDFIESSSSATRDPVASSASSVGAAAEVAAETDLIGYGPLALVEYILKFPDRLDRMIREPDKQAALIPRFLGISLIGFTFFGVAMSLVLSSAAVWPHLSSLEDVVAGKTHEVLVFEVMKTDSVARHWINGDAIRLIVAYTVGLIAATGICLPSLYFYALLSGIRLTMVDVVVHSLKSKAVAAVTLVGILPIYAAIGLGIAIFHLSPNIRDSLLMMGMVLPFLAGVSGTYSLYRGLSTLTDTMPEDRRAHRECFLQRLVLSWSACYSAVSPLLIFTLWQRMQG